MTQSIGAVRAAAEDLCALEKWDEAASVLALAFDSGKMTPTPADAAVLGFAYHHAKKYHIASRWYAKAETLSGLAMLATGVGVLNLPVLQAECHMANKHPGLVIINVNRAIAAHAADGAAYAMLGLACQDLEMYERAIEEYANAITLGGIPPEMLETIRQNQSLCIQKMKQAEKKPREGKPGGRVVGLDEGPSVR